MTGARQVVDLRLAVAAVAGWLAVLAGLGRAPVTVLVMGVGCLLVGGSALLLTTRLGVRRRWFAGAALALSCAAALLLPLAGRLAAARASPLHQLAAQRAAVTVAMTIRADPRQLAATGGSGVPRAIIEATVDAVDGDANLHGPVLVLADAGPWRDLLPGQRVLVSGRLQPPLSDDLLVATVAARGGPSLVGAPPWWQRAAGVLRIALRRSAAVLPDGPRGLLPGLIDGDTSGLDPVLAERFRLAGLTHLVAVSGTNCVIVVGSVLLVARRIGVRPWLCAALGVLVLVGFVVVARPSPSVLRAALMTGIGLVSVATGRPKAAIPALAASVLALLLWDPTLARDAGFTMSVLATAALMLIAPGWADALRARRVPEAVAGPLAVAAAAHVVSAPVIAALSGQVSLVAVPANLLAEPVVAAATVVGFLTALVGPFAGGLGQLLAWAAGWPCRWLVLVADFFGGLHGAVLPWPGGVTGGLSLLLASLAVIGLARRTGGRRMLAAGTVVALVALFPVRAVVARWPPPGWLFVACDVGQGDGLVLAAGDGAAVVVDTGPAPIPMDRCLRDLGVERVPLLVLTHYHLDHVGGIAGVLHGRSVGQVITGPLDLPTTGVAIVADALAGRGLPVGRAPVGASIDIGRVRLDVLAPTTTFRNTRSDPNNSSVVLRATVDGVRLLLPGDAEVDAQQALLTAGVDVTADVLKVAHHGSAYFDPDFLAAVHARAAVVSVGLDNDYGHPSPTLLAALARLGVPARRTDRDGDVAFAMQDGHLTTVERGTRESAVGLPAPAATQAAELSDGDARMCPCQAAPALLPVPPSPGVGAPPAISATSAGPADFRPSCCSSVTRSTWPASGSARSSPRPAVWTGTSRSVRSPEARSRSPTWPRC